jgi:hypothetical protein
MIPFLRDTTPAELLPFADLLYIKKYEFGEYIIKKGDPIKSF